MHTIEQIADIITASASLLVPLAILRPASRITALNRIGFIDGPPDR